MAETQAREEICRIGRSLFERGYVHATAGNISVRLDDGGFLITPTDACLGFLDPAKLARLDADMKQIAGDRASKTMALHARIYGAATRFDAGTRCVIHTHSTHCVALTLHETPEELLPALTPYFVMKVGHVPVIPYHRPGAPEAGDQVTRTIERYGAPGHSDPGRDGPAPGAERLARHTRRRNGHDRGTRGDREALDNEQPRERRPTRSPGPIPDR